MENALSAHHPGVVVVSAGAAQPGPGVPATMTAQDVELVAAAAPQSTVVAVHMDAVDGCLLSRDELRLRLLAARSRTVCSSPETARRSTSAPDRVGAVTSMEGPTQEEAAA